MTSRSIPLLQPRSRPTESLRHQFDPTPTALLAALIPIFLLVGCASPGPPRPPSLNLPQPVTDLVAQRIGNDVQLHWTTPAKTTDGLEIKGPLTVQICRELLPATTPSSCPPVLRLTVHPGPGTATEALPRPLTADPVLLLSYRVLIQNAVSRAAGLSNPAFAAAGSAPASVEELRATPIKAGAMLQWRPQPSSSIAEFDIELDRIDPALAIAQKATKQKTDTKTSPKQPLQLSGQEPAEIHLRPSKQDPALTLSPDLGGTIDRTVRKDETYNYTAQRVRTVHVGGQLLEIRTAASAPTSIVIRDIFPPPAPTGLAAVPTTGTTPSSDGAPATSHSIDLSWEPVSDPDLAGYLVYRQTIASGASISSAASRNAFERLTPGPIVASAFRDLTAVPGQRYSYNVTAIDRSGNESTPSPEVQETLP